jgi:hypothetical protein
MKLFVAVASLLRGPIEPAEVLNDQNQALAMRRLEQDDAGIGERVYWRDGLPFVEARQIGGDRLPRVSAELRSAINGPRVALDEDWVKLRSRRA